MSNVIVLEDGSLVPSLFGSVNKESQPADSRFWVQFPSRAHARIVGLILIGGIQEAADQ